MRGFRAAFWIVTLFITAALTACAAPAAEQIAQSPPVAAAQATSANLSATARPTHTSKPRPTCYEQGDSYIAQLNPLSQEWAEVVAVATDTPRERLKPHVDQLEEIRRKIEALQVPACWRVAHSRFLAMMDAALQGYRDRLAQKPASVVNESFQAANLHLEAFSNEVDRLEDEWLRSLTSKAAAETEDEDFLATPELLNLPKPTSLPKPTDIPPSDAK